MPFIAIAQVNIGGKEKIGDEVTIPTVLTILTSIGNSM